MAADRVRQILLARNVQHEEIDLCDAESGALASLAIAIHTVSHALASLAIAIHTVSHISIPFTLSLAVPLSSVFAQL